MENCSEAEVAIIKSGYFMIFGGLFQSITSGSERSLTYAGALRVCVETMLGFDYYVPPKYIEDFLRCVLGDWKEEPDFTVENKTVKFKKPIPYNDTIKDFLAWVLKRNKIDIVLPQTE